MSTRWLPAAVLLLTVVSVCPIAQAQSQGCKVIRPGDHDTVDALMQGLGGIGAVALLVAGEQLGTLEKVAAAAGLTSVIWNTAKSYFGVGQDVQVCVDAFGNAAAPKVYLGPPGLTESLYRKDPLNAYLNSQSGFSQWQGLQLGQKLDVGALLNRTAPAQ